MSRKKRSPPPLTLETARRILSEADQHTDDEARRALDVWLADNDADEIETETVAEENHRLKLQMRAVLTAREKAIAANTPPPGEPVFTPEDREILGVLEEHHPLCVKQFDIAEALRLSRPTVRNRLNRLRTLGLTHHPNGERKGETITERGRSVFRG